jgi:hypothetical protein
MGGDGGQRHLHARNEIGLADLLAHCRLTAQINLDTGAEQFLHRIKTAIGLAVGTLRIAFRLQQILCRRAVRDQHDLHILLRHTGRHMHVEGACRRFDLAAERARFGAAVQIEGDLEFGAFGQRQVAGDGCNRPDIGQHGAGAEALPRLRQCRRCQQHQGECGSTQHGGAFQNGFSV